MWVGRCCALDERSGSPRECHALCLCLFRLCNKLTRNTPRVSLATICFVFLPSAFGLRSDAVASFFCGFRTTCENIRQCTVWKLLWRRFDHDGGGKACAQQSLFVSMRWNQKGVIKMMYAVSGRVKNTYTHTSNKISSIAIERSGMTWHNWHVQWTWDKAQSGQCALELQLECHVLHSTTF